MMKWKRRKRRKREKKRTKKKHNLRHCKGSRKIQKLLQFEGPLLLLDHKNEDSTLLKVSPKNPCNQKLMRKELSLNLSLKILNLMKRKKSCFQDLMMFLQYHRLKRRASSMLMNMMNMKEL